MNTPVQPAVEQEVKQELEQPPAEAITLAPQTKPANVNFGLSGFLPRNFEEAWRFANALSRSSIIPDRFRGKPADCFIAMEYAANLRVPTLTLMKYFMVVNGSPAIWGDLMLAIVMNHPQYENHKRYLRGSGDQREGVFEVKRKGHDWHIQTFSVKNAKEAELWGNVKKDPWIKYPERMLEWRAQGWALRDKFADALCGLISVEEARDLPPGPTIDASVSQELPVDDLAELKQELADFYKNELVTDSEGKRWNDARITVMVNGCGMRENLQAMLDAGKAELARRKQAAEPAVETVAEQSKIPEVQPSTQSQPATASHQSAPVTGCKDCESLGAMCFNHVRTQRKERHARAEKFLAILSEIIELLGKEPVGPPSISDFDKMTLDQQDEEIAEVSKLLAALKAEKQAKATVNQPHGDDLFADMRKQKKGK